jgi:hypothetical protein
MTYERFLKIIMTLKHEEERVNKLYQNKVDLIDFVYPYQSVITELIKEVYGEEGYDWFYWFCYDTDFGKKSYLTATDKDGNPICYDIESLHKHLENL